MEDRVYTRELGPMRHLLNTDSDDLNTSEKYSFTLTGGVVIPDVSRVWWNREELRKLDASSGVLNVRPGLFLLGRDRWWDLKATDGAEVDAEIGRDVQRIVEQGAIPFFQRFMTPLHVAEFLSEPPCKADRPILPASDAYARAQAAILWKMLGRVDRCKQCVEEAIALSRKTPGRDVVDRFVARFSCEA